MLSCLVSLNFCENPQLTQRFFLSRSWFLTLHKRRLPVFVGSGSTMLTRCHGIEMHHLKQKPHLAGSEVGFWTTKLPCADSDILNNKWYQSEFWAVPLWLAPHGTDQYPGFILTNWFPNVSNLGANKLKRRLQLGIVELSCPDCLP